MKMLGEIRNFLYRHRRKFLITGGIVGGLVLLSRYAEYKLFQWHDRQTNSLIEKQKRRQHYEKTRQTANATVLSLSNSVTKIVCDELDIDGLLHALRNKPANKIKLWEELKIMGFSRCISTVYISALAGSLVHAKLMLLGGYSFGEIIKVGNMELKITSECQEKYLCHLQNFIEKGIPSVITKIRQATKHRIKSLRLEQQLTLEQLEGILKDIILLLNEESSSYLANSDVRSRSFKLTPWNRYVIDSTALKSEDISFQKMTEEMLDVIDGEDFCLVVHSLVQHGLNHIIDYVAEFYPQFSAENVINTSKPTHEVGLRISEQKDATLETKEESSSELKIRKHLLESNYQSETHCGLMKTSLPVAKLLPILTDLVHPCLSPAPGHLLQFILLSEQLENLSFNIYEAFSIPN